MTHINQQIRYLHNILSALEKLEQNVFPLSKSYTDNIQNIINMLEKYENIFSNDLFNLIKTSFDFFDKKEQSAIYERAEIMFIDDQKLSKILSDFINLLNIFVNQETSRLISKNEDVIRIINEINSDETSRKLHKVDEILKHKEQQYKNDIIAHKQEISKKLDDMNEKAKNNVCINTLFVGLLIAISVIASFYVPEKILSKQINGLSSYFIYVIIYVPLLSLIWYFLKQRTYAVKISTDYQFKKNTMTLFLFSHNWVAEKIDDSELQKQTYAKLVDNLLHTLSENPARLYDKEVKGLPFEEVTSLLKEIIRKEK